MKAKIHPEKQLPITNIQSKTHPGNNLDAQFVSGLFDDGWTPAEIARATGLPIADVKALVAGLVLA